ncbi:MAG: hypothetical protein FJ291_16885 [Planctomycetes bacterium]|nr:hypothetical protein [Planctomycetota bacterium]
MRVGTRLFLLKLALAAAVLAILLIAMHILLPGLLGSRPSPPPGEGYVVAEAGAARVAVPREGANVPAGSGLALQLARHLDAFVRAFCAELGPAVGLQGPPGRVAVNVFDNHADALAFAREHKLSADPEHAGAFHGSTPLAVAVTLRPYPDLLGLILHQTTHALMSRAAGDAQWSPWLALGLAVCAEQGGFGPAVRGTVGPVIRRDAAVVLSLAGRAAHVPLHMLVRGDAELFRGPLGPVAYRESGLLVLFLLHGGPKRREAFLRYLQTERQPGPVPPGSLEATLGTDLTELEKEWFAFLQAVAR